MEATRRYRRTESVSFTELDGEIVCLNLEQGEYVGMRDVGQTIWERLDEPREFDDLLRHVTAAYDVPPDVAASDIDAFLSELVQAGLVEAV